VTCGRDAAPVPLATRSTWGIVRHASAALGEHAPTRTARSSHPRGCRLDASESYDSTPRRSTSLPPPLASRPVLRSMTHAPKRREHLSSRGATLDERAVAAAAAGGLGVKDLPTHRRARPSSCPARPRRSTRAPLDDQAPPTHRRRRGNTLADERAARTQVGHALHSERHARGARADTRRVRSSYPRGCRLEASEPLDEHTSMPADRRARRRCSRSCRCCARRPRADTTRRSFPCPTWAPRSTSKPWPTPWVEAPRRGPPTHRRARPSSFPAQPRRSTRAQLDNQARPTHRRGRESTLADECAPRTQVGLVLHSALRCTGTLLLGPGRQGGVGRRHDHATKRQRAAADAPRFELRSLPPRTSSPSRANGRPRPPSHAADPGPVGALVTYLPRPARGVPRRR
jgi:hypothetical protein